MTFAAFCTEFQGEFDKNDRIVGSRCSRFSGVNGTSLEASHPKQIVYEITNTENEDIVREFKKTTVLGILK